MFSTKCNLFADDFNVPCKSKILQSVQNQLQNTSNNLINWTRKTEEILTWKVYLHNVYKKDKYKWIQNTTWKLRNTKLKSMKILDVISLYGNFQKRKRCWFFNHISQQTSIYINYLVFDPFLRPKQRQPIIFDRNIIT